MPLGLEIHPDTTPKRPVTNEALSYIDHLRVTAVKCRAKRKTGLFEACALLHMDRGVSQEAYSEALMRGLNEAVGTQTRLLAPGTPELTFDERWLVELGRSIGRGDEASVSFLLQSRVAKEHRRLICFLVGQISECFHLT